MRAFISRKLEEIIHDFSDLAGKPDGLCGCRSFADTEVGYAKRVQQDYYLLHYLPAYLAEYWHVYTTLLARDFLRGSLNVVSIGCGCGLDLWGLCFAFEDYGYNPGKSVSYIGVDHAAWGHVDRLGLPGDRAKFRPQWDATTLQVLDGSCNVLHFPMSLSERDISPAKFNQLLGVVAKGPWTEDRVVLIATSHKRPAGDERARLEKIAEVLRRHSYEERTDVSFSYDDEPSAPIEVVCQGFHYPKSLRGQVDNLHSLCVTRKAQPDHAPCRGCKFPTRRAPVQRTENFHYLGFALERAGG
jgi:hypothetical protein